ncbi:glutamine amidotransferase family protein [bacterium]|nr:glutamine amidotransferase family protein [bacterium]
MEREKQVADKDYRVPSACGIFGMMSRSGRRFDGSLIIKAMANMRERSNGLGGGFAAYGIYPQYSSLYAFHLIYDNDVAKNETEKILSLYCQVEKSEPIPFRYTKRITSAPLLWRYFLSPKKNADDDRTEEDFIVDLVMLINRKIPGAFVASSGKNMGIFKGVGYPEEIGEFFRLDEYEGYIWIGHGRFPTNSVAWWGGAHPFGLLDWSVVHNGEISSYGINRRYLSANGYECTLFTDTEVIAYLVDLLVRRHQLPFELMAKVLCPPLWEEIERMPQEEAELHQNLRIVYSEALVNGPFAIIVGFKDGMLGLTDRIKLRPLVAAEDEDMLYISSEEGAIREIQPSLKRVWMPTAGEPVIGKIGATSYATEHYIS